MIMAIHSIIHLQLWYLVRAHSLPDLRTPYNFAASCEGVP